jgi:membrane-associated phospholipid phosphatase
VRRAVVLVAVAASLASAQDSTARHGPLFTRTDAALVGVAAATSVVLFGADAAISRNVRAWRADGPRLDGVMQAASASGDPGTLIIGAGLWASGAWAHDRTRRLVGRRAVEAILVSGVATGAIKALSGRARPDESPDNATSFEFGRGIGDRSEFQSFPSGHATAAFAFASAVDAEWQRLNPQRPRWVAPVLYAAATAVAASRVYRDRHWTSDVVLGGAIGFVAGRAVVRWNADRP